jgi:hypothetical protein
MHGQPHIRSIDFFTICYGEYQISDKLSGNSVLLLRNIRQDSSVSIVTMLNVGQSLAQGTTLTELPSCLYYSVDTEGKVGRA